MTIGSRICSIRPSADPRSTYNLGVVSGGTSVNTIADVATMEMDLRSESTDGVASLEAEVLAVIESARNEDVAIEVSPIGSRPAGSIPRDHPLVAVATEALERVGAEPRYPAGSTDVNALLAAGIPAVCVGVTTGGNAHRTDEWIETEQLARGFEQLAFLIRGAAGLIRDGTLG
jgi:acetylornithine deacetylase/succinyl-diaminopimelate desuccinylase-like protein